MEILIVVIVLISSGIIKGMLFEVKRKNRRDYYRNDYLKSDAWKRKRFVVLRRDNWECKYCGAKATQVQHLKYFKFKHLVLKNLSFNINIFILVIKKGQFNSMPLLILSIHHNLTIQKLYIKS